jgi:hypothetical protein
VGRRLLELFPPDVDGAAIHGVYFANDGTINLMRHVLRGLDRGVLNALGYTKGSGWPGTPMNLASNLRASLSTRSNVLP